MIGDGEYIYDSSINQWTPNYPKYQNSRPTPKVCRPLIPQEDDYTNIYFSSSLKTAFDGGFDFIHKIAEGIITHPFIVIRRQCQVQYSAHKCHIIPYTLVPALYYLHKNQGVAVLWKGIGSVCLIKTMMIIIEDVISSYTAWPKIVNIFENRWRDIGRHILLKCSSWALITPYYAAALAKTVQSDIAKETPNVLEVLKNGSLRFLHWGMPRRMLPMWSLVVPCVALGLTKYVVTLVLKQTAERFVFCSQRYAEPPPLENLRYAVLQQEQQVRSTLVAHAVSDALLYPGETLMHRCLIQGTGTIVDNLDTGKTVTAVLTSYSGVLDCYRVCLDEEGARTFYRGIGALVMQYASYALFVHVARAALVRTFVSIHRRNTAVPPPVPPAPHQQTDIDDDSL